ncbi:MAG: GNAT family N-acetyltransferase [Candidatus Limnocylindrales bacterium]
MTERPMRVEPVVLEGDHVRMEPMSPDHLPGLLAIGLDPTIWTWMPLTVRTAEDIRALVEAALKARDAGMEFPFVTVDRASGRPVGSSRYLAFVLEHARLEIGWTWIAPAWQRSAVNTEAKLLMLGHAFDVLGCRRVEFKTDSHNEPSRRALLGIGATFEGIFRKHMLVRGGERRDSAWYSITDDEWPDVRVHLEARLARGSTDEPRMVGSAP